MDTSMVIVANPNGRSEVWKYFGLLAGEGENPPDPNKPVCRWCGTIMHTTKGSTARLIAHLRSRQHKIMLEEPPRDVPGLDDGSSTLRDGSSTPRDASGPLTALQPNYVSDTTVPPGEPWLESGSSRAILSVPFCLNLRSEPEPSATPPPGSSSNELVVGMGVHAKVPFQEGIFFGPFVGEVVQGAPGTSLAHAWIIKEDSEFSSVDATDENKSNWMRYVSYAPKEEDHNLVVMQLNHQIYYKTSKPVSVGAELKVWIGEEYVGTLCLDVADTRCDFGKKESILRLFLDVQLVTLEEPSSSLASTPPMLPQTVDTLTNAICNFLIRDLYPPAMVEGQGFRELMRSLLPSYKELVSAGMLEAPLKELHIKKRMRVLQLLRCKTGSQEEEEESGPTLHCQMSNLVTLSADLWLHAWQGETSRNATLRVHYIDDNFDSQNWALTTQRLVGTETEGVEAQLKAMALEWGIVQSHIVLLGGDPAKKGTVGLERRIQNSGPDASVHSPNPHIPCFFAAVQGCIEDVMSFHDVSETLRLFQEVLLGLFTVSPKSNPFQSQITLLLAQIPPGDQAHLQSWSHCPLSWKSLYTVISILTKHKKVVSDLIKLETGTIIKQEVSAETDTDAGGVVVPGEPEWKVLLVLCSVLKPTDVACRTLAEEAFPRLSMVKPILAGLLTRHLAPQPGDAVPLAMELRRRMKAGLEGSYENPAVNRVLCVACSLDPRFRSLRFMEATEQTATRDWLKEEVARMQKEAQRESSAPERRWSRSSTSFAGCNDRDEEEDSSGDGAEANSPGGLSGMQFLLGSLLGSPAGGRAALEEEEYAVEEELALYVVDKRPPPSGVKPLEWWKSKAGKFPLLAAVARVYLAAPAVAGSAAQDFMTGGDVNRKRGNMPPESLAEMLFLHHNNVTASTD